MTNEERDRIVADTIAQAAEAVAQLEPTNECPVDGIHGYLQAQGEANNAILSLSPDPSYAATLRDELAEKAAT